MLFEYKLQNGLPTRLLFKRSVFSKLVPKSANLQVPSLLINIFPHFKSVCIIPFECISFNPNNIF